jgi:hypothetical protein
MKIIRHLRYEDNHASGPIHALISGRIKPQSTYRGRGEEGGVHLPSQLERTLQLCT